MPLIWETDGVGGFFVHFSSASNFSLQLCTLFVLFNSRFNLLLSAWSHSYPHLAHITVPVRKGSVIWTKFHIIYKRTMVVYLFQKMVHSEHLQKIDLNYAWLTQYPLKCIRCIRDLYASYKVFLESEIQKNGKKLHLRFNLGLYRKKVV